MAKLKAKIAKLDDVDEAYRALYTASGSEFVLQVEGMVSEDDHNQLKQEKLDADTEAKRRRIANEKFQKIGETPEAIQKLIDDAGKGGDKDQNAIIEQMETKHKAREAELTGQINEMRRGSAMSDLKSELLSVGVLPDSLDLIANLGDKRINIDDDGKVKFMTADGKPMVGTGEGNNATAKDIAKELAAAHPRLLKDGVLSGDGKPPAGKTVKAEAKTINRTEFDALDQPARAGFLKEGGAVVD